MYSLGWSQAWGITLTRGTIIAVKSDRINFLWRILRHIINSLFYVPKLVLWIFIVVRCILLLNWLRISTYLFCNLVHRPERICIIARYIPWKLRSRWFKRYWIVIVGLLLRRDFEILMLNFMVILVILESPFVYKLLLKFLLLLFALLIHSLSPIFYFFSWKSSLVNFEFDVHLDSLFIWCSSSCM